MFVIIARCANSYGVIDTTDNVVEWFPEEELRRIGLQYEIDGIMVDGTIFPNHLYYVDYRDLKYGLDKSIFEEASGIVRTKPRTVGFVAGDKRYKFSLIDFVYEGSIIKHKGLALTAPMEGYAIKMTNGILTIIPKAVFNAKFASALKLGIK